ncbi:unnamed protein product [Allacma fusca]|uniref:Uncharacterized protein n=1 Tax=Allacma fusca TaxID=39272 RepID=A0A8J2NSC0_9HEXA|nr:unnamed protein product [Allacma fusca]
MGDKDTTLKIDQNIFSKNIWIQCSKFSPVLVTTRLAGDFMEFSEIRLITKLKRTTIRSKVRRYSIDFGG